MIKKILLLSTLLSGATLFADTAYDKGIKAYQSQQYNEALKYFYISARQQNINAYVELGMIHEYGIGTGINTQTAFYWYEKAALNNHPKAQYRLGRLYETGVGIQKDSKQALEWYRRASDNGSQEAKERLAGKPVKEQPPIVKVESLADQLAFWKTAETKPATTTLDENMTDKRPAPKKASILSPTEVNASNEGNESLIDKLSFWKITETKPTATTSPDVNTTDKRPLSEKANTPSPLEENASNEGNESLAEKLIFWK